MDVLVGGGYLEGPKLPAPHQLGILHCVCLWFFTLTLYKEL
jgi:hypothetical protein